MLAEIKQEWRRHLGYKHVISNEKDYLSHLENLIIDKVF